MQRHPLPQLVAAEGNPHGSSFGLIINMFDTTSASPSDLVIASGRGASKRDSPLTGCPPGTDKLWFDHQE